MDKTLFVDCTYTFETGGRRGVPRVVRNLIRYAECGAGDQGQLVVPVIWKDNRYIATTFEVLENQPVIEEITQNMFYRYAYNVYEALCNFVIALIPHADLKRWLRAPVGEPGIANTISKVILQPLRWMLKIKRGQDNATNSPLTEVIITSKDMVFFPDCVWSYLSDAQLAYVKHSNAKCALLCHDIIPVTHPYLCRDTMDSFRRWLYTYVDRFDVFVSNSLYTQSSLQRFCRLAGRASLVSEKQWLHFRLGASIDVPGSKIEITEKLSGLGERDYFLTVSAIEPRKNHELLLRAAEILWLSGEKLKLVWVGKWTRASESLRQEVLNHPEYGRQLFVYEGLNDHELEFCYQNAKAFVFPSIVEGFGLPLVEAMAFGLPLIISDTEIHREVAANYAEYVDCTDVLRIAEALRNFDALKLPKKPEEGLVLSWSDAANRLYRQLFEVY